MLIRSLSRAAAAVLSLMFSVSAHAGIKVLVAGADVGAAITDVVTKMKAAGVLDANSTVDSANLNSGTPTLATLKGYDVVLVFTNLNPADGTTFGNNLADYVDSGGNVVEAMFCVDTGVYGIHGRWESQSYSAILHGTYVNGGGGISLGAKLVSSHPILNGVTSFTIGSGAGWQSLGALGTGSYVIANWSNNVALIATKHDKAGHIVFLNFFPVSTDIYNYGWVASGNNGGKLLANTVAFAANHQTDVLVLGAPGTASWLDDVRNTLYASGRVGGTIDTMNAHTTTPTVAQLNAYDSVLVFSDQTFQDSTTLGNNLASYIDAGGGVVTGVFTGNSTLAIGGRFASGGYAALTPLVQLSGTVRTLGTVAVPGHPIMSGVSTFNGGSTSYQCTGGVASGASLIASWSNGVPLVATRDNFAGRVAALNFYPPSSNAASVFWTYTTDGTALLGNATKYAARRDNDVLILGDNVIANAENDVITKLRGTGLIAGRIDAIDVSTTTPSLSKLRRYDSVLVYSTVNPLDAVTLGTELADYVDGGGGVLLCYGSNLSTFGPTGRWTSGTYSPLIPGTIAAAQHLTLGTRYLPTHSLLNRVHSLDDGVNGHYNTGAPRAGSVRIIDYSNGAVLAAERSTKGGRVVELNMFPPSDSLGSGTWDHTTDGALLMADGLNYVARSDMSVLIAATTGARPNAKVDITAKIVGVGRTAGRIDFVGLSSTTPPLALLSAYDAVLLYTESVPASQAALGDLLAAYNDLGYGIVSCAVGNNATYGPLGRWNSDGYAAFNTVASPYAHHVMGTVANRASPVMAGVVSFDNGTLGALDASGVTPGASRICDYDNGFPLAAEKKHSLRQVVALNFYPESQTDGSGYWVVTTDGALLMSNALTYVSKTRACPADFNNDGFVDIFDFNDFVTAFESGAPSADFNNDGFADIFDFNDFTTAFEVGC